MTPWVLLTVRVLITCRSWPNSALNWLASSVTQIVRSAAEEV
jgi:hypothetical protein